MGVWPLSGGDRWLAWATDVHSISAISVVGGVHSLHPGVRAALGQSGAVRPVFLHRDLGFLHPAGECCRLPLNTHPPPPASCFQGPRSSWMGSTAFVYHQQPSEDPSSDPCFEPCLSHNITRHATQQGASLMRLRPAPGAHEGGKPYRTHQDCSALHGIQHIVGAQ